MPTADREPPRTAEAGAPNPGDVAPLSKAASRLARRIEADVAALGWPTGTNLGSEAELLDRYQVSRSIYRQAVRLLEQRSVAENRRGTGGGLVVVQPSPWPVVSAASTYLHYRRMSAEQFSQAGAELDAAAVRLAAANIDADGEAELRDLLAKEAESLASGTRSPATTIEGNLHIALARIGGNPGLELFAEIVFHLSRTELADQKRLPARRLHEEHREIVDAVIARDAVLAAALMVRHAATLRRAYRKSS